MVPVYVFSSGEVAKAVFDGVAAFIGTNDFISLLAIGGTFSLVGALVMYMQSHNIMVFARWFAIYFIITTGMLGIKTSIQIIDVTNPMRNHPVDNIPVGLAMPAYLVSTFSYAVATGLADVFHIVDDENYLKTGMLFGGRLYYTVTQGININDAEMRENIMNFTRQCVIPDIIINRKYTIQSLVSSPNLLQFLSGQTMSPLRGIYMGGVFKTCAEALPLINQAVTKQLNAQTNWLSRLLYGDTPVNPNAVNQQLAQAYNTIFVNMGQSAQEILVQNMMINAMRKGIQTSFAATNAPAAMLNYSETSALQKQLLADNVVARTATYLLPLMQTVLFLICIGVFPLIILFALQPWLFVSMLKNYLASLIYLGIWPSLFVIINFLMTTALSHSMNGIAIDQGGITLSNQNALLYATQQFAGYAGYLIGLVPVMAGFLFFGLHRTFMSAAQTMVGSMQSRVSSSAESLAEGNVNVGNVSAGNHSWNNWNANKHDLNSTNFQGSSSTQQPNGAVLTQTAGGTTVLNTSGAISQLPTHINWSNSVSQTASEQASHHRGEAASMASNFQSSIAVTSQSLVSLANSQSQNEGSGKSWNLTDNSHVNEALHHASTVARQYAERHNITDQQANQVLFSAGFSGNAGFGTGRGAGVQLGASGDMSGRIQKTGDSIANQDFSDAKEFAMTSGFSKDINFVQDASRTQSYHANTEEGKNLLSSLSTHLDNAQQASQQWSSQLSEAENYDKLASIAQSQGAAFNQNLDQHYVEWLAKQTQPGQSTSMGFKGANEILTNPSNTALSREYANQFVQQQTEALAQNFQAGQGSTAFAAGGISSSARSRASGEEGSVAGAFNANKSRLLGQATMNNLSFGNRVDKSAQIEAEQQLSQRKSAIEMGETVVNTSGSVTQQNSEQHIKDGIKGNVKLIKDRFL